MTGRTLLIFISTFVMGAFAGAYLYVSAFAPTYESGIQTGESIGAHTLVIEGQMYGGCSRAGACASFRLVDGKKYSYLSHAQAEVRTGTLSSALRGRITREVTADVLKTYVKPISSDTCSSYMDGVDYSYTVSLEGQTYLLDTCSTSFSYAKDLQALFYDVWFALENPDAAPDSSGFNAGDLFKERFQSTQ